MKLTAEEVALIIQKLLEEWKRENLVTLKVSEIELRDHLIDVFLKNLKAEDDLYKEIETMLQKYERDFESGKLDRRKMFNLIKAQLVKDRKLVL